MKLSFFNESFVSKLEACLLISAFSIRFSLSTVANENLIELLKLLLPYDAKLPNTFNKLLKFTLKNNSCKKIIKTCIDCNQQLEDNAVMCNNENCERLINSSKDYSEYFSISIREQIISILTIYFKDIINYKYQKREFIDIIDSKYYKNLNRFAGDNNITLIICTDGIQRSKHPSTTIWPILASILELPPSIRNSIKNKLIAGVWYAKQKPNSDILFRNFFEQIEELNKNKILLTFNGTDIEISISIYGLIADTPAKSLILNMKGHNGYYGCPICKIPGKNLSFFISNSISIIFIIENIFEN